MSYQPPTQGPQIRIGTGFTPVVKAFMIACGGAYILEIMWPGMVRYFGATPALFWRGMFWQPATFNFLHALGSPWHLVFNLLVFYMFAPELERKYGRGRFIGFLAACGVGAGLLVMVSSPLSTVPTIGASGIVFGVMLIYAILHPNRTVLFMFVIPMRIKWLMLVLGGLEFYFLFRGGGSGVSHVAHVGGMAFGFLYLRYDRAFFRFRDLYYRRKLKRLKKKYKVVDGGKSDGGDGYVH